MRGLLITGTDTGVGKTVVGCGLARMLRNKGYSVGVLKPVETGWDGPPGSWPPDARMLAEGAQVDDPPQLVAPCVYRQPLAPLVAARLSGRPVDLEKIEAAWRALQNRDWVLVETAGGLSVPVTEKLDWAALAARWQLPVLVVARPTLGTINHTFLTVHYARSWSLPVVGVVICGYPDRPDLAERTNPQIIEEWCQVPVLGIIPYCPGLSTAKQAIEAVAAGLSLDVFLRYYCQSVGS